MQVFDDALGYQTHRLIMCIINMELLDRENYYNKDAIFPSVVHTSMHHPYYIMTNYGQN